MRHEEKYFADARKGPSRYFKQQRFFACEGLICIVDERPSRTENGVYVEEGDCIVLTPKEFTTRIKAVTKGYRNRNYSEMTSWLGKERKKYHMQARGGYEAVAEARDMGDPSDPVVQAYWAKHRGKPYVSMQSCPDIGKLAGTKGDGIATTVLGAKKAVGSEVLPKFLHLPSNFTKSTPTTQPT